MKRYPCKRKRLGHRQVQKEDLVKTQREDGHLQVKERPPKGSTLPPHWSQTSSLQNCKKVSCLSFPVYGSLPRRSWQTNMGRGRRLVHGSTFDNLSDLCFLPAGLTSLFPASSVPRLNVSLIYGWQKAR